MFAGIQADSLVEAMQISTVAGSLMASRIASQAGVRITALKPETSPDQNLGATPQTKSTARQGEPGNGQTTTRPDCRPIPDLQSDRSWAQIWGEFCLCNMVPLMHYKEPAAMAPLPHADQQERQGPK